MGALPLPTSSSPGVKPQETDGRLINLFPEKNGDVDVLFRICPGLSQLFEVATHTGLRGAFQSGATLILVMGVRLFTATVSGTTWTVVDRGSVPGSDYVAMAQNNKSPTPDIALVADSVAYLVSLSGAIAVWPDADVGSPNSVTSVDGYFIWTYGDGKFRNSDLNSTAINTLNYGTAESKPDTLLRGIPHGKELFLLGTQSFEAWRDAGNANGSPFSFITAKGLGLFGAAAVAGHEDGWAETIIFAASDRTVRKVVGYELARISTHSVERDIQAVTDATKLRAFVYAENGHQFWHLSYSDEWTWVHDLTTGSWHERRTGEGAWRADAMVSTPSGWLCGDATTGKVYVVSSLSYRDGTDEIVWTAESRVAKFPATRAVIRKVEIDMTGAVGRSDGLDPVETDPTVRISWSLDGGFSWSNPLVRPIGAAGRPEQRPTVKGGLGLCQPKGLKIRIQGSDPVHTTISSISADAEARP